MRTVPEPIKLALADASLPIKKRLLLYRRKWNADTLKYALETKPIDVTDLLIEAGSIKMALDTDEVDKWDASNVTLIFNNDLNCFKEGLTGGLFENAVLWGSKVVYNIETAEKGSPTASITVFTGYVYSSPVFRDNGNRLELTVTSSLDALEYVSAESFCLTKTDELATAVTSQDSKDQGKEFATAETGVGYVDEVKYGRTLETAQLLRKGDDYTLEQTNVYDYPAQLKLRFTPNTEYSVWLSYRYWHKDMAIEDIVNALLDLAGVEKRQVEKAAFSGASAISYETQEPVRLMVEKDEYSAYTPVSGELYGVSPNYNSRMIIIERILRTYGDLHTKYPLCIPTKNGYIHVGVLTDLYVYASETARDWASLDFVTEDGTGLRLQYKGASSNATIEALPILKYAYLADEVQCGAPIYSAKNRCFVGFDFDENGKVSLYTNVAQVSSGAISQGGGPVEKTETDFTLAGTFSKLYHNLTIYETPYVMKNNYYIVSQLAWRGQPLTDFQPGQYINAFYNSVFSGTDYPKISLTPGLVYQVNLGQEGKKWNKLECDVSPLYTGVGSGTWIYQEGLTDGRYDTPIKITAGEQIPSSADKLCVSYSLTSASGAEKLENIKISKVISTTGIPLVNLTELNVKTALAQLAQMVSYEIGFNQDGIFFFRSRQGRYTDVNLTPNILIDTDKFDADIEKLANSVTVNFGMFQSKIDDFTENKPRPNSIDIYGVHDAVISQGNFIPADNVDVSRAVAKANYEALSTPGYTLQAECRPDLSLELGDKITVCAENTNIAAKNWSDYNKFLKLPVWKRVFKITGLELSFAKRLMTLTLKDVTTAADVPTMEYNVYQTQFPTPLNYKE